jgi:hypothetical protein
LEEDEKLLDYDQEAPYQPISTFLCHADAVFVCTGWVATGLRQPHDKDLLASRFNPIDGIDDIDESIEYFPTGQEAHDHGVSEIKCPGSEARLAIGMLSRHIRKRALENDDGSGQQHESEETG